MFCYTQLPATFGQVEELQKAITTCHSCDRLATYRKAVAQKPPRRFTGWTYWAKPVPGFGDPQAELWIVGLAPAAHGANRTGRMFTGDRSGEWLYRALYETGFANQPTSHHIQDGLRLQGAFISAALRCAPPANRPLPRELNTCFSFLTQEWALLKTSVQVIIPLGHIAYRQVQRLLGQRGPRFSHGTLWQVPPWTVLCSYHPSQQNTQTGRLRWPEWIAIFQQAKALLSA